MERIRVVLVDDSKSVRKLIEDAMHEYESLELVGSAGNGAAAMELIQGQDIDVVVTDLVMPIMDGFSLIETIHASKLARTPKIIVLTALMRDDFIERAIAMGADYYMVKPFDPATLCQRMLNLANRGKMEEVQTFPVANPAQSLDERLANIFLSVGIPAHIKGYHFLREAIKQVVDEPEIINAITKELYPAVARHFNTSSSKVERAIRHAIDVAWTRGQIENVNQLFGGRIYRKNEKPTNGEFIALIADRISIERSA